MYITTDYNPLRHHNILYCMHVDTEMCTIDLLTYGLTTLNKPKSREVSTNDGIITQNIFNAAVPTSIETK